MYYKNIRRHDLPSAYYARNNELVIFIDFGGASLGGRQIVVWMWDNFENLTKVLAKLRILL